MATESFVVTALPYSASPTADWHVSLFVAHRLTVGAGEQPVVGTFPGVSRWTELVEDAQITLTGFRGATQVTIPARRVNPLEPDLWPLCFPATLAVGGWEPKDHTARPWRTFPAHRMDVNARGVHAQAMSTSPVLAPQPGALPLTNEVLDVLGLGEFWERYLQWQRQQDHPGPRDKPLKGLVDSLLDRDVRWDERGTKTLDGREPGRVGDDHRPSSGPFSPTSAMFDVHAARRYYQRDEDAFPYGPQPKDGQKPPDPPLPPPAEFHQREGRLGDVPAMMRRLGLVLDLVVEDPALLAGLTAIRAEVLVVGIANTVTVQPHTACSTTGGVFTADVSTKRWAHGMLRLADEELFTLLDLDPDASALKLEQYLRNVPRLLALEMNRNDTNNAAPAALRSSGFALAELDRAESLHERLTGAQAKSDAVMAGTAPPLVLEQVTRGLRVEVWDDVSGDWHSLHRRRVDVAVDSGSVLVDAPDEAFLQGASLTASDSNPTTTYAHEVLLGWDGWSLAAPRPEKAVVHDEAAGAEVVREHAATPSGNEPVGVTSRPEPGSLPRLRYGRRYAFRAFAVDLAGNSRGPAGVAAPPALPADRFLDLARQLLEARRSGIDGVVERPSPQAPPHEVDLDRVPRVTGLQTSPARASADGLRHQLQDALAQRRLALRTDRRVAVEQAFADAVTASPYVLGRADTATAPEHAAAAWASTVDGVRGLRDTGLAEAALAQAASEVVTVPRPFLRWAPLVEPAVVPRFPFTWGESLMRLVVRSDVAADGTITPPATYAAAHPGLDWREDCQRHLAPPKTSLVEAEMHGMLDEAFGPSTPARRRKQLALALRESGTLLATEVADPDDPGAPLPVDELSFHLPPNAAPLDDENGDPVVPPTPATLKRGDPLLPGQYAVHGVEELEVPYLPDPVATSLALVFPDADPVLAGAEQAAARLGVQSVTLRYPGSWPLHTAYRLVLQDGTQLDGAVKGNVLSVSVPPGEQLRVRLASAMEPEALELFGLWHTLHPSISGIPQIVEAAADGWLWWLTPAAEMTLVHAVPRPVTAPRFTAFAVFRVEGDTSAQLVGGVELHGPSTERLDVEASWVEQHDDLAKPGPEEIAVQAVACHSTVGQGESLHLLGGGIGTAPFHAAVHQLGDTRGRVVGYRLRATTRYREFFPTEVVPDADAMSRLSEVRQVAVPSTVRPSKVVVRDVLPLFQWSDETQTAQPFGVRRTRRSGLRIYLDRPWFSSGNGELLAVVLSAATSPASPASQWAADPVWRLGRPDRAADLPLLDALHLLGFDDRPSPGKPVTRRVSVTSVGTGERDGTPRKVSVLGYQPEYDAARRLWFVDIDLDPGTAFWPFVRLAVARYQPNAITDHELGPVALCDFTQVVPERSLVVARTDDDHVKVAVSGPIGLPLPWETPHEGRFRPDLATLLAPSRTLRVLLERRSTAVTTDLGWQVVSVGEVPFLSYVDGIATWETAVALSDPHGEPARPGRGSTGDLRVVVEEEERLEADPGPRSQVRTNGRVVYTDAVVL